MDKKQSQAKLIVLVAAALLLVVAGAIMLYWYRQPLIDPGVTSSATFSVYTPHRAPEGYELNSDKTQLSSDTFSYVFTGTAESSHAITVTVQPKPRGFDMTQLISGGSISSTVVATGTLYDLSANDSSQYLLDTGDALVFLTSPGQIDTATINSLVASLEKRN